MVMLNEFGCDMEEVIVIEPVGAVMENVEVVPLETEATTDDVLFINTSAGSQGETSIESKGDDTEHVGDVLLTEFGKELTTTECVGENVVKDDVMIKTSAVSQTGTSVESEDTTTESVGENVDDDVLSQEDDGTQLSNEDEPPQVQHKLPLMRGNADDVSNLEDGGAESINGTEPLETEATECVEDSFDEIQTNTQLKDSVDTDKNTDYNTLTEIGDEEEKLQYEDEEAPRMYKPKVTFPATFASVDVNIQFGSFERLNDTNNVLLNHEAEPECFTSTNSLEPVITDLQASNSGLDQDEIQYVLEVIDLEIQKTVESVEVEHLDDQIKEDVLEEVERIPKTEEVNELTKEEIEAQKEVKAQKRKKRNALKAQKRAEKRAQQEAQEEAQQQERIRLKRLRKREKKRASLEKKRTLATEDTTSNKVDDEIVAESKTSNEFENQLKPAIRNKNRWSHRGNMIIAFVVIILGVVSSVHSFKEQNPITSPHRKTYLY